MLSISKVSADAGWEYLTRQIAHGADDYYSAEEAAGESPGLWVAGSERLLGLSGRVEESAFKSLYVDHADPRSGETLGRTRRVYRSLSDRLAEARAELVGGTEEEIAAAERAVRRTDRVSVDAFDLTFSPVKSVSVLWAAGDARVRGEVWAAQRAAVGAALEVLEEQAAYTRTGRHTNRADERRRGRYEDADGLLGAAWEHRMSRAGDPQIHTHVVLANLTRTSSDGRWRTLDGSALYRAKDAAAGVYDAVLATELTRRLGVAWRLRPDGKAHEVDGIGQHIRRQFSARRVQITAQLGPLVDAFTSARGRAPSAWELTRMSQWSTLANRPRKGEPESTSAAAERWAGEFAAANGRLLRDLADAVTASPPAQPGSALDVDTAAADALQRLAGKRTTWDRADLTREVAFTLGGHVDPALSPAAVRARIEAVTDAALDSAGVVKVTAEELLAVPGQWRRRDGQSVFVAPHSARYTVDAQLAVEAAAATASAERTRLVVDSATVDAALDRYAAASLRVLSGEQRAAVAAIARSGLRVSALVGPAGTGKTTTMDALRAVWQESTGGRVVGLSPSQIAANVLQQQASPDLAGNTARWLQRATADPGRWGLRAGDLVLIDEASMVADAQLAAVVAAAKAADARVLLVGDPAQLPAPSAGAAYGMVTRIPGAAVQLAEVHRFDAAWERAASLRLRAGDPTALDEYDRRARITGGTQEQIEEKAWRAWAADTRRGLTSLLITSTTVDVTALNERARAERIQAGQVDDAVSVGLADGTRASAGDRVVTRRNARPAGDSPELVNRARWQVLHVDADGSLYAAPESADGTLGEPLQLPADYVARHVELGYATTAYGAQGLTVDTAHAVVGIDGVDREALYVMLSRGRSENAAYVQTQITDRDGKLVRASSALAVLASSLSRAGAQQSATETRAAEAEAVRSTATLAPILESLAAGEAARRHSATLDRELPPEEAAMLAADPAAPALWREAFEAEIRGIDVDTLLHRAASGRDLRGAGSVAQVLRWRLGVELALHPPTGEWTGWAGLIRPDPAAPEADVLKQAAQLLDERAGELGRRAVAQPPLWALDRLGPVPDDRPAQQMWKSRAGVVSAWREYAGVPDSDSTVIGPQPVGPQPLAGVLWAAAHQALGRPDRVRDWQATTDRQLEGLVRWGRRALELAPPYVDRQLRAAHHELRQARTAFAEALAAGPAHRREGAQRAGAAAEEGRLAPRQEWVQTLEGKAERRSAWYTAAREAIGQGERAERELALRSRQVAVPTPRDRRELVEREIRRGVASGGYPRYRTWVAATESQAAAQRRTRSRQPAQQPAPGAIDAPPAACVPAPARRGRTT